MVCYVEYGTDFLCEFGDMYEQILLQLRICFQQRPKTHENL